MVLLQAPSDPGHNIGFAVALGSEEKRSLPFARFLVPGQSEGELVSVALVSICTPSFPR